MIKQFTLYKNDQLRFKLALIDDQALNQNYNQVRSEKQVNFLFIAFLLTFFKFIGQQKCIPKRERASNQQLRFLGQSLSSIISPKMHKMVQTIFQNLIIVWFIYNLKTIIVYSMFQLEELSLTSIFFTFFIILLAKFIFSNIVMPYRDYLQYKKILTQNYRTEVNPFSFLGMSNLKKKKQEIAKYNDSHHYAKTQLIDYQVRLMKVGPQILIDLIDPQLIKEYYQRQKEGCMVKRLTQSFLENGLIFSEGNSWKKKKKILSHVFNFEFIHSKTKSIAEIVEQNFKKNEQTAQNKGKEVLTFDIINFFQTIFGNVVIKNFFGDFQLQNIDGQDLYKYISELITLSTSQRITTYAFILNQLGLDPAKLALRPVDKKLNKMIDRFRNFSRQIIQKIIAQAISLKQAGKDINSNEKGIIWWIIYNDLLINNDWQSSDQKYNISELISEVITFFSAGTQTTAKTSANLVYILSQRPQILEKMKKQISQVLGSIPLTEVTTDILKKLPYLDSVIKQVLRMYTPLPNLFIRTAVKDFYLGKIPIRKGMQMSVKILTNQYKTQIYDSPLQFNPQRWLKSGSIKPGVGQSFFPFSLGQRNCIGQHLSLIEAKIAMVALLRRYKAVKLQNPNYKRFETGTYGPEPTKVYLTKN